jgi:uncharacterized phage protein (TIGR01671 family)
MREIKFRIHHPKTGEILAYEIFNTNFNWGYYWTDAKIPPEDRICESADYFKLDNPFETPIRVLWTGLKDKNGKEIYEGDILQAEYFNDVFRCGVRFDERGCFIADDTECGDTYLLDDHDYEIIGNVHEHPELLK